MIFNMKFLFHIIISMHNIYKKAQTHFQSPINHVKQNKCKKNLFRQCNLHSNSDETPAFSRFNWNKLENT